MASSDYHFLTHWRLEGTQEEVYEILQNPTELVSWWATVYLDVQELNHGDESSVGKVVMLRTRGRLPYTLRWQFRGKETRYPCRFTLEPWGDFVWRGIWTFEQDGP